MIDYNYPKVALITGLEFEARIARQVIKNTGADDIVMVAGLGGPLAEQAVAEAVAADVRGIVSFGVCGGLDPALPAGSVVMPEKVLGPEALSVDQAWRDRLKAQLTAQYDITTDNILTVQNTVETTSEKSALYQQTGACAVDMESAHLARLAASNNLPFIAVRVVHDPASQTLAPAFRDIVKSNGQFDGWKLVKGLIFNWPGTAYLKQMSDNDQEARANLAGLTRLALPGFGIAD